MGKTPRTLLLSGSIALLCAIATWSQSSMELRLKQGQRTAVRGANLTITAVKVRDLTSAGCEGGPRGCPDQVDLTVVSGKKLPGSSVTLYVAHTRLQGEQGINTKTVSGYEITLMAIEEGTAILSVQKSAGPVETPQKKLP